MAGSGLVFEKWRAADRAAHAAERTLLHAWVAALDKRGAPPSEAQRREAKRLRELADDLFPLAMAEFELRAQRAQKPRASR